MKIDLVFLFILGIVVAYIFILYRIDKVEGMADIGNPDQIKEAVKQIYLADIESIRNLSNVATKLQTDGLTVPGSMNIKGKINVGPNNNDAIPDWMTMRVDHAGDSHIGLRTKGDDKKNVYLINRDSHFRVNTHGVGDMFGVNKDGHTYSRHTGDHVFNFNGDGNNPYISLGKTDTMDKKKLYIQNADAHTENPTFRVGIHGDKILMNMNKSHGVYWPRKDGRNTHFDWEDGKNYIRGDTIHDNTLSVGKLCIGGTCIGEQELKYLTKGFYMQVADLPRADNHPSRWHAGNSVHVFNSGHLASNSDGNLPASALKFMPVNGV